MSWGILVVLVVSICAVAPKGFVHFLPHEQTNKLCNVSLATGSAHCVDIEGFHDNIWNAHWSPDGCTALAWSFSAILTLNTCASPPVVVKSVPIIDAADEDPDVTWDIARGVYYVSVYNESGAVAYQFRIRNATTGKVTGHLNVTTPGATPCSGNTRLMGNKLLVQIRCLNDWLSEYVMKYCVIDFAANGSTTCRTVHGLDDGNLQLAANKGLIVDGSRPLVITGPSGQKTMIVELFFEWVRWTKVMDLPGVPLGLIMSSPPAYTPYTEQGWAVVCYMVTTNTSQCTGFNAGANTTTHTPVVPTVNLHNAIGLRLWW